MLYSNSSQPPTHPCQTLKMSAVQSVVLRLLNERDAKVFKIKSLGVRLVEDQKREQRPTRFKKHLYKLLPRLSMLQMKSN